MNKTSKIEPIPVDWQKRPVVLVYNGSNELVERSYGKTPEELLQDHLNGECGMFCEYCYAAAMHSIGVPYNI